LTGEGTTLVGGSGLREPGFLELAVAVADGTTSFCSCADVSTSLELAAQRFIQDYQSEYGSAPGPYAVEGWDAARVLIRVLDEGGATRADLVARIATTTAADGLAGAYVFAGGELADPESAIRKYTVEGGRWVPAATGDG
jgi:branched-chain amino acid transport system substrate-binding protein